DKGNDYATILPLAEERVKSLICLGKDNEKLKTAFSTKVSDIKETQDMKTAVQLATKASKSGDVVLLSPACASFDLFKNYIDRGDQFRSAVQDILTGL
ncbi:MAG: UDP-N-acetylmuramoyl-L-alanine--D-glutamate ligase, partial [Bacteroidota bacterium]